MFGSNKPMRDETAIAKADAERSKTAPQPLDEKALLPDNPAPSVSAQDAQDTVRQDKTTTTAKPEKNAAGGQNAPVLVEAATDTAQRKNISPDDEFVE
jgi:hypothetical protein